MLFISNSDFFIKINKQQVISFFFGSILVKIWAFKKDRIQKSQKRPFHENLVFEFLFNFFSKNHPYIISRRIQF
jgi:hypothetical protein